MPSPQSWFSTNRYDWIHVHAVYHSLLLSQQSTEIDIHRVLCNSLVRCHTFLLILGENVHIRYIKQTQMNKPLHLVSYVCTVPCKIWQRFLWHTDLRRQIRNLRVKDKLSYQTTIKQCSYYQSKCFNSRPPVFTQPCSSGNNTCPMVALLTLLGKL